MPPHPGLNQSLDDYQPLHSSFGSYISDDYLSADRDGHSYRTRVQNAMSDFNGKSDHIVGIFLAQDFLLTNTMLYLLWCAYIPTGSSMIFEKEDILLAQDSSVFVSCSQ